jgi:hypothetical protein
LVQRERGFRVVDGRAPTQGELVRSGFFCIAGIDVLLKAFREGFGVQIRHIDGQDGKLVPSQTGNDVRFPEGLPENMGRIDQRPVPLFMAQIVVDPFQAVDIGECELRRSFGPARGFELLPARVTNPWRL